MKKFFERWTNHNDIEIRQEVESWMTKRSSLLEKNGGEHEKYVHPMLLAELMTRIVQETPNLSTKVLDIIFSDLSQMQWHRNHNINPDTVLSHVANRCEADEDWSAMPTILQSINEYALSRCHAALLGVGLQIMRSPKHFKKCSENFTTHTKSMMLPYCLAADPYNAEFISLEWDIEVNPAEIWRAIMVHTKNLSDLKDVEHLAPLSDKIDLANILDFLTTAQKVDGEFEVLSMGLKNISEGKSKAFNIKSWSYSIKGDPQRVCRNWFKLLDFPQNCINFNDKVALQHISEFAHTYGVSFASILAKVEKQILNEIVTNECSATRVRKI